MSLFLVMLISPQNLPSKTECGREQHGDCDEHNRAAAVSTPDTFGTPSYRGEIGTIIITMLQVVIFIITLLQVVILAYYNFRLVLTLTISLLTAKTILMTLFI